jgi:hypothetical protein
MTARRAGALLVVACALLAGVVGLLLVLDGDDGGPDPEPRAEAPLPPETTPQPAPEETETALPRGAEQPFPPSRDVQSCPVSPRGLPQCDGAWVGSAYGYNTDPTDWERELGRRLALRRTYWGGDDVTDAVEVARRDLRVGRIPWISFKLPLGWDAMAQGRGDRWTRDLATRLAGLEGPVWLAFHHEPEGDGDLEQWTAMQRRLAPIVRSAAPNVAYTVVLTGYHQLFTPEYSLDRIWPEETTVDLLAFDVYNMHGVTKDGKTYEEQDLRTEYWEPLAEQATDLGVPWALGETGYTRTAAVRDPTWLARTYEDLVSLGAVAVSYFNSSANSFADWRVNTPRKRSQFEAVLRDSPTPRGPGLAQ